MPFGPMTVLQWDQYQGGAFRETTGNFLWGEKAANVLVDGSDADKLDVVFFIALPQLWIDGAFTVPGRELIRIIKKDMLHDPEDGCRYLKKTHFKKVYVLKKDAELAVDCEPWPENMARCTKEEMEGLWNAAFDDKKVSEALVVHFTSLEFARLILSRGSHGLRASNVGQGGGGLSVVYCDSSAPAATRAGDDGNELVAFLTSQGLRAIAEQFSEQTGMELKAQLRTLREEDFDLEDFSFLKPWNKRQLIELVMNSTAHTLSCTMSSVDEGNLSGADTASEGNGNASDCELDSEEEVVAVRHPGNPEDFQEHMQGFMEDFLDLMSTQEPDGAEIFHLNLDFHSAGTSHQWTYCMLLWMRFAKDATFDESSRGRWYGLLRAELAREPKFLAELDAILRRQATQHDLWSLDDFQRLGCRKEDAAAIFITNRMVLHLLQRQSDSLAIWKREVENNWFENVESASSYLLRANRFLRQHLIDRTIILNQVVETQSYVAFMRMPRLASLLLFEYLEARNSIFDSASGAAGGSSSRFHGFSLFVSSSNRVFSLTKADELVRCARPVVQNGLTCLLRLSTDEWESMGPNMTVHHLIEVLAEVEAEVEPPAPDVGGVSRVGGEGAASGFVGIIQNELQKLNILAAVAGLPFPSYQAKAQHLQEHGRLPEAGVGMTIRERHPFSIEDLRPDGPAAKAGVIKIGDELTRVDGFSLRESLTGEQVRTLVIGPVGSVVELQFREVPKRTERGAYRVRLMRQAAELGGTTQMSRGDAMAPPAGMPPPPASPAGARVYDDDFDKDIQNAEQATKHQYDARRKKWARTTVTVCIDKKPFAEGARRQAFHMKDMSVAAGPAGHDNRYVLKLSKDPNEVTQTYFDDVEMQMEAKMYAEMYNGKKPPKTIDFLDAYVLVLHRPGERERICAVEKFIEGEYVKFNCNWNWDDDKRNTPQAFSHFTYEESGHRVLVCDIQGVGDMWTDPQIHSWNQEGYGKGNMGQEGMDKFLETHKCNDICKYLKLPSTGRFKHRVRLQAPGAPGATVVPAPRPSARAEQPPQPPPRVPNAEIAQMDVKGICAVCGTPVHSYQARTKDQNGSYVHMDCVNSPKKQMELNRNVRLHQQQAEQQVAGGASSYKNYKIVRGSNGSVGLTFKRPKGCETGPFEVVNVVPAGAASFSGIKVGTFFDAVDGVNVSALTNQEVTVLVKGKPSTPLELRFCHPPALNWRPKDEDVCPRTGGGGGGSSGGAGANGGQGGGAWINASESNRNVRLHQQQAEQQGIQQQMQQNLQRAQHERSTAPPSYDQASILPEGWKEYKVPEGWKEGQQDGRPYYHHAATNTTQWERPAAFNV